MPEKIERPATLEECVRDERWNDDWVFWPPIAQYRGCDALWTVHDSRYDMRLVAEGQTIEEAAAAALATERGRE